MELRYPILVLVVLVVFIIFIILVKNKDIKYLSGSKIANTKFVKNTKYYKNKIRAYKALYNLARICLLTSIVVATILLARPASIESKNRYLYSRDIFLCMDVSASVDDLNSQLVNNLKYTVDKLHGERFGISIFNSSSVTVVPLTTDYDFVRDSLTQISKGLTMDYNSSNFYDYYRARRYIISGTIEDANMKGSSLIGDGLASCIYSFPKVDEDRTKIIIFSTDNDLAGKPLLTLDQAAEISKKKNIRVYGIGTEIMKTGNEQAMREAIIKTGGKFYKQDKDTVKNIVSDIEKTTKSLIKGEKETREDDMPEIPFMILLISTSLLIILDRKVIL